MCVAILESGPVPFGVVRCHCDCPPVLVYLCVGDIYISQHSFLCLCQAEMDAAKKGYHETFQTLRDTKSEIERVQRVFEAGKLRMHADFDSWCVRLPALVVFML